MAADLCGYSKFAEQDEDRAIDIVEAVRRVIEARTEEKGGRVFHVAADGFLVEFPSARDCLEAALAIMADLVDAQKPFLAGGARLRIGLHVGDVVDKPDGDLLGHGVNIASRLQQNAEPNQIVASEHFVNLVSTVSDREFLRLGAIQLKNIDEHIVAFDVGLEPRRRSWLKQVMNTRLLVSIIPMLLLMTVAFFAFFQEQESIDRRAIQAATEVLVQSNLPVDAAISALLERRTFDGAVQLLIEEQESSGEDLSVAQRVLLLHQAGALAYYHDKDKAQWIYRQIQVAQRDDWLAALQLARIHLTRSEKAEAASKASYALELSPSRPQQMLMAMIEHTRARAYASNFSGFQDDNAADYLTYSQSSEELARIAAQASEAGFMLVELRARSYSAMHRYASLSESGQVADAELGRMISEVREIVHKQFSMSSYADLARTAEFLALLHVEIGNYDEALDQFEVVLGIEEALGQAEGKFHALTNIAGAYFQSGALDLAREKNREAIALGASADLVGITYFNKALSSEIEFAAGRQREGCRKLREAKAAWPPEQSWPDYLEDLNQEGSCRI
ncbi:MAG: adenylate/guanylate cyclase domain-containing protein [Pseudomonadota bacterium]